MLKKLFNSQSLSVQNNGLENHLRVDIHMSLQLIAMYFFCNYFMYKLIDVPVGMMEFLQPTQKIMNYVIAVLAVLVVFFRSCKTLSMAAIAGLLWPIFLSFDRAAAEFLMLLCIFALFIYFGFGLIRNLEK